MRVRFTSGHKTLSCQHGCPIRPNHGQGLCGTCLAAKILGCVVVDAQDLILSAHGNAIGREQEIQKLILAYPVLDTEQVQLPSNGTTAKRREAALASRPSADTYPAQDHVVPEPVTVAAP